MVGKLFVYGTLRPDHAPAEIASVRKKLKPIGEGTIRAQLHRFPGYPAIRTDAKASTKGSGHVFRLTHHSDLEQLDA